MAEAIIKTRCEECGAVISFPASQLDTVQECPECDALVDVIPETETAQPPEALQGKILPKPYDWKSEHERLWAMLVPKQGQADTLQGELIRIAGKLTDEAYRNGNMNWDSDCERMWRFVARHLDDPETFTPEEREEIRNLVEAIIDNKDCPDLSGEGSTYYIFSEKVVDWCMAHPEPIPHKKNPILRR